MILIKNVFLFCFSHSEENKASPAQNELEGYVSLKQALKQLLEK